MVNATSRTSESPPPYLQRPNTPFQSHEHDMQTYEVGSTREELRHNRLVASYLAQTRPYNASWQNRIQQSSIRAQAGRGGHSEQSPSPHTRPPTSTVQPQHRVYILRCAHCDNFVSDRGMRAVLLLRPHITLFSTDACPSSCGALYSSCDEQPEPEFEQIERTCDCLTQSLGCYCCGNVIGYQIVVPCARCTATVGNNSQRASNGHRYVFHHNEVTFAERKFQPGETGIARDYLQTSNSAGCTSQRSPSPDSSISESIHEADRKEALLPISRPSTRLWMTASTPRAPAAHVGPRILSNGDTIYWHHLLPAGELSFSTDPRSRAVPTVTLGR